MSSQTSAGQGDDPISLAGTINDPTQSEEVRHHALGELVRLAKDLGFPDERRNLVLGELIRAYQGFDPNEPAERRHTWEEMVWDGLTPTLIEVARRVARRLPRHQRDDFVDEALELFGNPEGTAKGARLGQFRPDQGQNFLGWCWSVLQHHAETVRRKGRTRKAQLVRVLNPMEDNLLPMKLKGAADGTEKRGEAQQQAWQGLLARLVPLRVALDQVRWAPSRKAEVDFYAVLLLHLRLALAARVGKRFREDQERHPNPSLSPDVTWCADAIADVLPWRVDEKALRLWRGGPTLEDLWQAFAPVVNRLAPPITANDFCQHLTQLAGQPVTPDAWYAWKSRAKKEVRRRLDAATWEELFAEWFQEEKTRPPAVKEQP